MTRCRCRWRRSACSRADREAVVGGLPSGRRRRLDPFRSCGPRGTPGMPREMVELIEGLALGAAAVADREVHRTSTKVARERGWPVSSYAVVRLIVLGMDRGLLALAHHGPDANRDEFEHVLRQSRRTPTTSGNDHSRRWLHRLGDPTALQQRWPCVKRSGARPTPHADVRAAGHVVQRPSCRSAHEWVVDTINSRRRDVSTGPATNPSPVTAAASPPGDRISSGDRARGFQDRVSHRNLSWTGCSRTGRAVHHPPGTVRSAQQCGRLAGGAIRSRCTYAD